MTPYPRPGDGFAMFTLVVVTGLWIGTGISAWWFLFPFVGGTILNVIAGKR